MLELKSIWNRGQCVSVWPCPFRLVHHVRKFWCVAVTLHFCSCVLKVVIWSSACHLTLSLERLSIIACGRKLTSWNSHGAAIVLELHMLWCGVEAFSAIIGWFICSRLCHLPKKDERNISSMSAAVLRQGLWDYTETHCAFAMSCCSI